MYKSEGYVVISLHLSAYSHSKCTTKNELLSSSNKVIFIIVLVTGNSFIFLEYSNSLSGFFNFISFTY